MHKGGLVQMAQVETRRARRKKKEKEKKKENKLGLRGREALGELGWIAELANAFKGGAARSCVCGWVCVRVLLFAKSARARRAEAGAAPTKKEKISETNRGWGRGLRRQTNKQTRDAQMRVGGGLCGDRRGDRAATEGGRGGAVLLCCLGAPLRPPSSSRSLSPFLQKNRGEKEEKRQPIQDGK